MAIADASRSRVAGIYGGPPAGTIGENPDGGVTLDGVPGAVAPIERLTRV
jgi:hypothetical protein